MKRRIVLTALALLIGGMACLTDGGDDGVGSFLFVPCEDPAPFQPPGTGAAYAGYIVYVREGLDVADEAARLTSQCMIPLDQVHSDFFTIPKVDEIRITCLRCDPAVASISPNPILQPL